MSWNLIGYPMVSTRFMISCLMCKNDLVHVQTCKMSSTLVLNQESLVFRAQPYLSHHRRCNIFVTKNRPIEMCTQFNRMCSNFGSQPFVLICVNKTVSGLQLSGMAETITIHKTKNCLLTATVQVSTSCDMGHITPQYFYPETVCDCVGVCESECVCIALGNKLVSRTAS